MLSNIEGWGQFLSTTLLFEENLYELKSNRKEGVTQEALAGAENGKYYKEPKTIQELACITNQINHNYYSIFNLLLLFGPVYNCMAFTKSYK